MRERERERGEFFRARQRVSFRAHTHTQRPTRRKKNLPGQKKKSLLSSSCRSRPLPQRERSRGSFQVVLSLSRSTGGKRRRSIDRSRRARARRSGTSDRWDRGRLPSLRETTHRIVRGKWEGGARSFKPNTPMNARAHRKLLERFCFRRRTRERKRDDDDDDDDDAPSSCTRSTDSPRFFYGLLDCSSRVRFAFAFVSSSRRVPRPPRRRRLRCERFEVALPFESLLLHRLLLRMYSSVREGESRA